MKPILFGLTVEDALNYIHPNDTLEDFELHREHHDSVIGTHWFNSLIEPDKKKLIVSFWDPRGSDNWQTVLCALVVLLDPTFAMNHHMEMLDLIWTLPDTEVKTTITLPNRN